MEERIYTVSKIEGEYATLIDCNDKSEIFIALSLLPFNTDIGTKLLFKNFTYTII